MDDIWIQYESMKNRRMAEGVHADQHGDGNDSVGDGQGCLQKLMPAILHQNRGGLSNSDNTVSSLVFLNAVCDCGNVATLTQLQNKASFIDVGRLFLTIFKFETDCAVR